ncbi:MAG TPA: hypothetical protein VLN57_13510 [Xanthobacteraceae bacterium]|nr:hypothetical protein [Xanthobacteraceae bacterium]
MMKALLTKPDGRTVLMIGLSFRNLDHFRAEPLDTFITIDGSDTGGLPIDVVIFSGRTEEELAEAFADRIGPDTKLHIDPRLRS